MNSAAIRTFAKNLEPIMRMVEEARSLLRGGAIDVPAGAFPHAMLLRQNVMGSADASSEANFSSGVVPVVPGSRGFLDAAYDALHRLQDDTRSIAKIYEDHEHLNTDQAKHLNALLQDAGTYMGQATGSPTSPTSSGSTTGGSNGESESTTKSS